MDGEGADVGELTSLCSRLGGYVEDESGRAIYVKHDECLESLRDLLYSLRQDEEETRPTFMLLGQWNIVQSDLLPILQAYHTDHDLVIAATKLVVFMTLPIDPDMKTAWEQQRMLQRVKGAFLDGDTSAVVVSLIAEPLARFEEKHRMDSSDTQIVQLVLTLFRNLLCIPDRLPTAASAADHLSHVKNELLGRFFSESVIEVLVLVAQDAHREPFVQDTPLLLEIIHEIFKGHEPADLAKLGDPHKDPVAAADLKIRQEAKARGDYPAHDATAAKRPDALLVQLMEKENQTKTSMPNRHARFGGVYRRQYDDEERKDARRIIRNGNPLASDAVLQATSLQKRAFRTKYGATTFGHSKPRLLTKNKLAPEERRTECSRDVRMQLQDFADQMLAGPYNKLMGQVASDIEYERARGLSESEQQLRMQHFLRMGRFFLAYMRYSGRFETSAESEEGVFKDSPFALVSETVDQRCFKLVRQAWTEATRTKGQFQMQGFGLSMLKEMLYVLDSAQQHGTDMDQKVSHQLALAVLADETDEGVLRMMHLCLTKFAPKNQPRSHIIDCVEGIHVSLQLLSALDRKHNGMMQVRQKRMQRRAKAKAAKANPLSGDGAHGEGLALDDDDEAMGAGAAELDAEQEAREAEEIAAAADEMDEIQEKESQFNLQNAFMRLLDPVTVNNVVWLLKDYRQNDPHLNTCVLTLLGRMMEMNLAAMLWQLSVLSVFQTILTDRAARRDAKLMDLYAFAQKFVRRFFEALVPSEQALQALPPATAKGRLAAANMLFVEVLFWTQRPKAVAILEDLDFDSSKDMAPVNERGYRKRPAGGGGRRSRRVFDAEDDEDLVLSFVEVEAEKDCVERLVEALDGKFSAMQIQKRMRELGLCKRRGGSSGWGAASRRQASGEGGVKRKKNPNARAPPKHGATRLFEEGPAEEEIEESEDEPSDAEERNGMEDEAGMERGEPTDTMRGGLDDEDEAAAPGELAQVRAALVQAHAEGVVTAAAAAAWVLGKLAAAAELWQALMQHCRSSLDDFTLVPVDDTDWEMLDSAAVETLLEAIGIRPPCHGHMFWRVPSAWGKEGVEEAQTVLRSACSAFGCNPASQATEVDASADSEDAEHDLALGTTSLNMDDAPAAGTGAKRARAPERVETELEEEEEADVPSARKKPHLVLSDDDDDESTRY